MTIRNKYYPSQYGCEGEIVGWSYQDVWCFKVSPDKENPARVRIPELCESCRTLIFDSWGRKHYFKRPETIKKEEDLMWNNL